MLSIFFFQAEDGIRDGHVTGVQTCALPIFEYSSPIYRAELMMTGRIFAQDAELYADIVFANKERRDLLMKFYEHQGGLVGMVKNDDKKGFIKEFEEVDDFLESFGSEGVGEDG